MSTRALKQLALATSIDNEEDCSSLVESELVCLVQEPDATLVVRHMYFATAKRFSVSATTLRLASKYFDRLFYGNMAEAQALANAETVTVDLIGDDHSAVEVILRVLHHQRQDSSVNLDLGLLANIALHADKYDVSAVLEPWITQWLDALQPIGKDPIDIGLFLLATYRVGAISRFFMASSLALRELAEGFERSWSSHEILQHIPRKLLDALTGRTQEIRQKLRRLIEDAEAVIRTTSTTYEMKYVDCCLCARRHPLGAKKCHPCKSIELRQSFCTIELRVSSYMEALRRAELWGSSTPLDSLAAADIHLRMTCAKNSVKHICDAGRECPLKVEMETVTSSIQLLLDCEANLPLQELDQEGGVSVVALQVE